MEIVSTIMTQQEAVTWERQIGSTANELRRLLAEGYEREAWKALGYSSWSECLRSLADKHHFSEDYLWKQLSATKTEKLLLDQGIVDNLGTIPERQLRPLAQLETDTQKIEAWNLANETAPDGKLTSAHVQQVVINILGNNQEDDGTYEYIPPELTNDEILEITLDDDNPIEVITQQEKIKSYITLTEWEGGKRWQGELSHGQMNTVNDNIEWAAFSWNPITGCLHNCAYCYARDIANRFYDQKFEPSFIPERLSHPKNTRSITPRWDGDIGYKNVFTCSMADLFGKWVPQEWIEQVLQIIHDNSQWTFLLLTKFPIRMAEFIYPKNVWLGTTVDYQWAVDRAEKAFRKIKLSGFNGTCWLSCEPMMERLTFSSLDMFDWVVMGGSSRSSQTPEYKPPFDDIVHLHNQARASNCKIYQKTNLIPGMNEVQRIREYP